MDTRTKNYKPNLFQPKPLDSLKHHIERSDKERVEDLLKQYQNLNMTDLLDLSQRALNRGDIEIIKVITKVREDILKIMTIPKKLFDETNTYDFSNLIAAIESGKNVEEALKKFREDIDNIVEKKGFPFQALIDAYKICDSKPLGWCWDKPINPNAWYAEELIPLSKNVIGYFHRVAPDWLKKELATGFYYIAENVKKCGDTFELNYCPGQFIDPKNAVPNSGLGFDFCVGMLGYSTRLIGEHGAKESKIIEEYFRKKINELDLLRNQQQILNKVHSRKPVFNF